MQKLRDFYNNKYGILIIVSWVVLLVCLVIKLIGGNWFELGVENDKFITFCGFVDDHLWLKMILACIIYLASGYPIICIILNKKKLDFKEIICFAPLMIVKSILGWYFSVIAFILDIFILLGLTTIFNKKPLRNIICFLIITLFQLLTIGIRNISFWLGGFNFGNSFIEQLLYQVDYYLMILLFYLYNFKNKQKEVK